MNVSLTPDLEEYAKNQVESGLYNNISEVMRTALRLLKERNDLHQAQLQKLNMEIEIGLDQIRKGEVISGEEAFSYLRTKYKVASS